jgi:hypothetical protein
MGHDTNEPLRANVNDVPGSLSMLPIAMPEPANTAVPWSLACVNTSTNR